MMMEMEILHHQVAIQHLLKVSMLEANHHTLSSNRKQI